MEFCQFYIVNVTQIYPTLRILSHLLLTMSENIEKVLDYLKTHEELYVQRLREWVAIPSVSASVECRPEVIRMVQKVKKELELLGASVDLVEIGEQAGIGK